MKTQQWTITLTLLDNSCGGEVVFLTKPEVKALFDKLDLPAGMALIKQEVSGPKRQLIVSNHAVIQYMRRSGTQSKERARNKLSQLVQRAESIELKDRYKVIQLLNHDFKDAEYLFWAGWVFVVRDEEVITVHKGEAKRWKALNKEVAHA